MDFNSWNILNIIQIHKIAKLIFISLLYTYLRRTMPYLQAINKSLGLLNTNESNGNILFCYCD